MYAEEDERDTPTAFRIAEKKYQKRFDQVIKYRKGKPRGSRLVERPTDLSGIVDVDADLSAFLASKTIVQHPNPPDLPHGRIYTFPAHSGMVFIRGALLPDQQRHLCIQCLKEFNAPPAHTNFNRSMGRSLPPGLWNAAQQNLRLAPVDSEQQWTLEGDDVLASHLLRKLRWASIGLIYDWTRRIYVSDWGFMKLPLHLADLALKCVALAPLSIDQQLSAQNNNAADESSSQRPFVPDAALVNYYREGDTLGGHIDDAEPDLTQPLVALSLGRPGIFLLGGLTRDQSPTPLIVRSGDVVVLSGPARRSYHGVPRIFSFRTPGDTRQGSDGSAIEPSAFELEAVDWGEVSEEFKPIAEYMNECRINISIRSTAPAGNGTNSTGADAAES